MTCEHVHGVCIPNVSDREVKEKMYAKPTNVDFNELIYCFVWPILIACFNFSLIFRNAQNFGDRRGNFQNQNGPSQNQADNNDNNQNNTGDNKGQQNQNQNQNQHDGGRYNQNDGGRRYGNNDDGNRRYGNRDDRGGGGRRGEDFMIQQRLRNLTGPTHELPPVEYEEVKFSGRNRLYVGNLPQDVKEEDLREWFKPYGEINEAFVNNEKNFAFLKVDFHANAERAKRVLDGSTQKNRQIRIRFAPNATTIRVKNLTSFVTNELLHKSFEVFGPVSFICCHIFFFSHLYPFRHASIEIPHSLRSAKKHKFFIKKTKEDRNALDIGSSIKHNQFL